MAHIVIDARKSGTSTGRYIDKLIENLQEIAHEHKITLLTNPKRVEYIRHIAPDYSVLSSSVEAFTFAEQIKLKKELDALGANLVHFPMVQQPVLYRGNVVTTIQDLTTIRFRNPAKNPFVFWAKQQVYKWLNRRVARKSAAIITPTEFVRQDVATYCQVPLEKITVTLEAADVIPDISEPLDKLIGKQFIMYTGRPTPHKNLERLIDAFVIVQKSHPELVLVLAGKKDVNYARHEERVRREGIQNVVFTGVVSEGQLRWLYENCAAYVFPSLSEGFGLPGLEAMVHGAPVVSSNATCLPEVYGDAAHYFDPLDVGNIARKIAEVLDDKTLRSNLIQKGRTQAAKYSWRRMAEQTLAVYEKALQS
ncbi:MAG: glycosyltransferase family 1 protein [Candidatus Saccharimonadales bacterium]